MRAAAAFILLVLMLPLEFCLVGLDTLLLPVAYALTNGAEGSSPALAFALAILCLALMFVICRHLVARLARHGRLRFLGYLPFGVACWSFALSVLQYDFPSDTIILMRSLTLMPCFLISWLVVIGLLLVPNRTPKSTPH